MGEVIIEDISSNSEAENGSLSEDTSDSESEDSDTSSPAKSSVQVSNFTPSKSNVKYLGTSIIAALKAGESLVFQGQYTFTVQKGSISIYGATLHVGNKKHKVLASAATALPRLTSVPTKKKYLNKVIKTPENTSFIEESDSQTIILVESISTGLEDIPKVIPKFQNLWGPQSSTNSYSSPEEVRTFHPIYVGPLSIKTVTTYESWLSIAADILRGSKSTGPPVVFVTGPKNSGKSTFCRFLLNHALSHLGDDSVYFLDCDPGQTEFSPPGTVYLSKPQNFNFSSPFTHPFFEDVIKSHSLGHTSPKDIPLLFSACFENLYSLYKSQPSTSSPSMLIVNTPGWTKGLGLELLIDMMKTGDFSHAIFLGADDVETFNDFSDRLSTIIDPRNQFQKIFTPDSFLQVSPERSSVHHSSQQYTASDMRMLQLLSYFHYNHQTEKFDFNSHISRLPYFFVPFSASSHLTDEVDSTTQDSEKQEDLEQNIDTSQADDSLYAPKLVLSLVKSNDHDDAVLTLISSKSKFSLEAVRQSARIFAFGVMAAEGILPRDIQLCLEDSVVSILAVKNDVFVQISEYLEPVPITTKSGNQSFIPWIPPAHITSVLSPTSARCLGLAILHGIDGNSSAVKLRSSLNPQEIDDLEHSEERLVIIRGRICMP